MLGHVPQSLLVASGGRAAAGKAEDESCGGATAEDGRGPREIAQRFRGAAMTQPGADPSVAQQSVGLRETP
jgi:hypothetical protein